MKNVIYLAYVNQQMNAISVVALLASAFAIRDKSPQKCNFVSDSDNAKAKGE